MGSKTNWWVISFMLIAALWVAGRSGAEETAGPHAFNSALPLDVYAIAGGEEHLLGSTPSEQPPSIPPCQWWYVEPRCPVDMADLRREAEAQGIPGLKLRYCTDAGLAQLRGLTGLRWLNLRDTQVTDAGVEQLEKSLPHLAVVGR